MDNIYTYADGSNNTYILTGGLHPVLSYQPIQPKESSSGIYSGGESRTLELTLSQYSRLAAAFEGAASDTQDHLSQRTMISGLIRINRKGGTENYILRPQSPAQLNLEKLLADCR